MAGTKRDQWPNHAKTLLNGDKLKRQSIYLHRRNDSLTRMKYHSSLLMFTSEPLLRHRLVARRLGVLDRDRDHGGALRDGRVDAEGQIVLLLLLLRVGGREVGIGRACEGLLLLLLHVLGPHLSHLLLLPRLPLSLLLLEPDAVPQQHEEFEDEDHYDDGPPEKHPVEHDRGLRSQN